MIMDYRRLPWILKYAPPGNRMDYKIRMHPKHLTTPERYGAGMAHTVTSIVHVLSWSYCGLLWIIDYHGLSWIIMDYLGLALIIMDYGPCWIITD